MASFLSQMMKRTGGRFARMRQHNERAWTIKQIKAAEHRIIEAIYASTQRTSADGEPRNDPLAAALREIAMLRWSIKLIGVKIASELYGKGMAGPDAAIPNMPHHVGLTSKICCQADIEAEWFRYWCGQLHLVPFYSRKLWEYAFVLHALWEAGQLEEGHSGLGFAVGTEPLPSFLASRGLNILATDLDPADERASGWHQSGQHSAAAANLFKPDLVDKTRFDRLCKFRSVDMNLIPGGLYGGFDFCWSMCSFEHLGSVELGLEFVRNSIKCLKPGGLAVHTTEFNLERGQQNIDQSPTVLFQRRHIEELSGRLAADGHVLAEVNYDTGLGLLDLFVDVPPHPWDGSPHLQFHPATPHMRLSICGFPATSIGLIVKAAPSRR